MTTLTCPLLLFQALLRGLAARRRAALFAPVGVRRAPGGAEWLMRSLAPPGSPADGIAFSVALAPSPPPTWPATTGEHPHGHRIAGQLFLGEGPARGRVWGWARGDGAGEPLDRLHLVGPGMHWIPLEGGESRPPGLPPESRNPFPERWSRTIGALGGEAVWRRLTRLRVAIVGAGRTGSLVAVTLRRLGVQWLSLVDPDLLEAHNVGEMDGVTTADVGRPKAEALADHLRCLLPDGEPRVGPIVAPIAQGGGLEAAKACDVLLCCADNDAARLAAALVATLYHKVLVDIGTGVFAPTPASRRMGADVRLIVPGDGCLLCWGNLVAYAQAVEDLCNHRPPSQRAGEWTAQRAGSLRTVNQVAAGLAVQMLQDLVAERLRGSTWAHLGWDDRGKLTVQYPPPPRSESPSPLCAKAGLGDLALRWA